jgi:hypothetical protein
MKKLFIVLALIALIGTGAFAQDLQDLDLSVVEKSFSSFAQGVSNSLPLATTVGLQWSDAYIGRFPHLGVGMAVGFASIPFSALDSTLAGLLGVNPEDFVLTEYIPQEVVDLGLGLPFPAAVIDARIGVPFLPFDFGFKFGKIPGKVSDMIEDAAGDFITDFDYLNFGFDIRYPLVKERKMSIIPDIIVGGGYNYYRGGIQMRIGLPEYSISMPIPDDESIENLDPTLNTFDYTVTTGSPDLGFSWESHVIDLKAQISKKLLLLFTPYAGVGASYGRSRAGGGLYTNMDVTKDGNPSSIEELNDDIEEAKEAYEEFSKEVPEEYKDYFGDTEDAQSDLDNISIPEELDGIVVNEWTNGWGFRAYGGLSINLWFIKIDASVMYDILGKSLGAQVGLRLQF